MKTLTNITAEEQQLVERFAKENTCVNLQRDVLVIYLSYRTIRPYGLDMLYLEEVFGEDRDSQLRERFRDQLLRRSKTR